MNGFGGRSGGDVFNDFEPEAGEALLAELHAAAGLHPALDHETASLRLVLHDVRDAEASARFLVERLALALQASVLLRANSPIADDFCRSRLSREHGLAFGTLAASAALAAIIRRAAPA